MLDFESKVIEKDFGWDEIMKNLVKLPEKKVKIGIQANENSELLQYANVQEFGAEIDHPGGTAFGFKFKKDVEANKISFLKKGQGFLVLGITKPHKINIPSRPFIRQTFDKRLAELAEIGFDFAQKTIDGQLKPKAALELWGDKLVSFIRSEVTEGNNFVANAPATIRQKGGGLHPLQGNTGRLMNALKAVIVES